MWCYITYALLELTDYNLDNIFQDINLKGEVQAYYLHLIKCRKSELYLVIKMPKAKYKRKGAPLSLLKVLDSENNVNEKPNISKVLLNEILASSKCSESCENELNILSGSEGSILRLPEEMMCMILQHLPMAAIARMEQTCKHLRTIIIHARIWRKILLTKIEFEPELKAFLPDFSCLEKQEKDNYDSEIDSLSYKRLLENLKLKLDYTWMSAHSPNISRTNHVFGELEEEHFLYHIISTGRHFLSFWGPMKTDTKTQRDYIIDVFDRTTLTKGNLKLKIFFFKSLL